MASRDGIVSPPAWMRYSLFPNVPLVLTGSHFLGLVQHLAKVIHKRKAGTSLGRFLGRSDGDSQESAGRFRLRIELVNFGTRVGRLGIAGLAAEP